MKALDEEGAATVQREKEEREKREIEEAEQKANGLTEEPRRCDVGDAEAEPA